MPANLEAYRDRTYAIKAVKEGLPVEVYTVLKEEINVSGNVLSKALRLSERTFSGESEKAGSNRMNLRGS